MSDVVWEILLAIVLLGLTVFGIGIGIKASNDQKKASYNSYAGGNQILSKILEIKDSGKIYVGRHKSDIRFMFDMKQIYPIIDNGVLLAYMIPEVNYTINYGQLTILGKGYKTLYWLFQFDTLGRLVQHGILTEEQMKQQ